MNRPVMAVLTAATILSGCSEFDARTQEARDTLDDLQGTGVTETANLPSGTARYEGTSVFAQSAFVDDRLDGLSGDSDEALEALQDVADEAILASDATIDADFDNNTLSGELTDFIDEDGNEFSGTVDLFNPNAGGAPNITDNGGEADILVGMSGAITDDDGEQTVLTGAGSGFFGGDDADSVFIGTEATANGGLDADLGGFIVAERD